MAKKNKNIIKVKGVKEFARQSELLKSQGYMVLPGRFVKNSNTPGWSDMLSAQLSCGCTEDGKKERKAVPSLFASSGNEQPCPGCGSQGLGWMEWGAGNRLPNVVSLLTGMLPYTATGWKFNTDLVSGLGPRPMYRYARYVGGGLQQKEIPYEDAGILIKGILTDLLARLIDIENTQDTDGNSSGNNIPAQKLAARQQIRADIQEQINECRKDYDTWKKTNAEVQEFMKHNNLAHTFLQLFADEQMLGICFPEILLNRNEIGADGKPVKTETWTPRAVGISFRPAHICRLERRDGENRINYVYVSNRWLDTPVVESGKNDISIDALPALGEHSPVLDLERIVRKARSRRVAADKRPTRFILPVSYPTVGRPYYPVPSWHSIFGGDIYEYAATIISDRATRRKNANIVGRIIYIHNDFLQSMYVQEGADTPQKKDALRDKMFQDINSWLGNRDNSGQALVAFTFRGPDGKECESFKIVEIESSSKNTAEANQKELSEVSSIIFFAMGLDSRLVGNTPGTESNSGGTDLRERYLLKQIQMSPTQQIVMKPLEVIRDFNGWDSHLVWRIKREVMTTLDNSKTGVTEQETT